MSKRKASKITVRHADGTAEVVGPGAFQKRGVSYAGYRRSRHWRRLRKAVLERDDYRCAGCRRPQEEVRLEVHHRVYDLGRERLEDLVTLCQRCHATEHQWKQRMSA